MTAQTSPAALSEAQRQQIEARTKTGRFLLKNLLGDGGLHRESPLALLLAQQTEDIAALTTEVERLAAALREAQKDATFRMSRVAHWLMNDRGYTRYMAAQALANDARIVNAGAWDDAELRQILGDAEKLPRIVNLAPQDIAPAAALTPEDSRNA